jgi:hypothetical protein
MVFIINTGIKFYRNDWGAIILVDNRYFKNPAVYTKGLSKWIKERYIEKSGFNEILESLKEFVDSMKDFNKDVGIIPVEIDFDDEIKFENNEIEDENDEIKLTDNKNLWMTPVKNGRELLFGSPQKRKSLTVELLKHKMSK